MVMVPSFTALIEKTDETMCVTLASTELAKCHNPQKQARTFGRLQSKLWTVNGVVSKAYPAMTVMNKTYLSLLCWLRRVFGHHS